jgi:hypothetical protein
MLHEMLYRIRGVDKWPHATATVISTKMFTGYRGSSNTILFSYAPGNGDVQKGKIVADDKSTLYEINTSDTFQLQYNPNRPSRFYCEEAKSISTDLRIVIFTVVIIYFIYVAIQIVKRKIH